MMKLSGNNIISDEDIDITNGNLIGEKLSDILEKQQNDIEKLKSNVKWLYKYGGVGSGSGNSGSGGGTSALSWSIFATLDNNQIRANNSVPITLSGTNTYSLYIKINQPQGATFNVKITYNSLNTVGSSILTKELSASLDINNSYSITIPLKLDCNGKIIIKVTDSIYSSDKMLNASYIIDAFKTKCELVDNNGSPSKYLDKEVFLDTAESSGINLKYSYEIAVPGEYNIVVRYTTMGSNSSELLLNEAINVSTEITSSLSINLINYNVVNSENLGIILMEVLLYSGDKSVNYNSLTFTLISDSLYLSVIPENGNIYNNSDILESEDIFKFSPGYITLNVRPYYKRISTGNCTLTYKFSNIDNNSEESNTKTLSFGRSEKIPLNVMSGGRFCIKFKLTYGSLTYPTSTEKEFVDYYFIVSEPVINLSWFGSIIDAESIVKNYWSPVSSENFSLNLGNDIYQNTVNSLKKEFNPNFVSNDYTSYPMDTIISIGLQYSEVNDTSEPLFIGYQFDESNNNSPEEYLSIYQNKIQIKGHEPVEYFFPKERDIKKDSFDNYHLLNIVTQYKGEYSQKDYYEVIIYIDGIIEAMFKSWVSERIKIDKFTINPFNGFINLLDVAYFIQSRSTQRPDVYNEDIITYHNYIYYYVTLLHPELTDSFKNTDKYKILEQIEGSSNEDFKYLDDGIQCNLDFIKNIAKNINIPTILFTAKETETFNRIYNNKGYKEDDPTTPYSTVNVQWCSGNNGNLTEINPPGDNCVFQIKVQGSSTKEYKCKNWEFSLENNNAGDQYKYLFSPNYKSGDSSTFLPEKSFTLKADVVDSSHSNNTSIGRFVNKITKKFDTNNNTNNSYDSHIKNCLEGFPCLVFICYENEGEYGNTTSNYYYEGIYNFNLGRSSHHNLGYIDSSIFSNSDDQLLDVSDNNFTFYKVLKTSDSIKKGLVVAEIQGNSAFFDFSQYDNTVLFKISANPNVPEPYMFGDIVYGDEFDEPAAEVCIKNLVEKVAFAGGYIFQTLKKSINDTKDDRGYQNDDGIAYKRSGILNTEENSGKSDEDKISYPLNMVPDYRYQFTKSETAAGFEFKEKEDEPLRNAGKTDLINLITNPLEEDETSSERDRKPWIDYRSLCEY